jgi:hypothetical protein
MQAPERNVVLDEVNVDDARRIATGTSGEEIRGIEKAIPRFTKVDQFTTFSAEYAFMEGDIILHFFLPDEVRPEEGSPIVSRTVKRWWEEDAFPDCMTIVAKAHFDAGYPRIIAKYTEELCSWWFRGRGFASSVLDPDALVISFLEKLDAMLDERGTPAELGAPSAG